MQRMQQKISIKPNPDTNRVNLDINLRLVDFLNDKTNTMISSYPSLINTNQKYNHEKRMMYQEPTNDPLARHIQKFEQSARSFPGIPMNNKQQSHVPQQRGQPLTVGRKSFGSNPELQTQQKVQKDGYMAQLLKANSKPNIRPHTLKDFHQYKRDNRLTHGTTGKLGFDFDSDQYKNKLKQVEKKQDYAMRVKARNARVLQELPKKPLNPQQTHQKPPIQQRNKPTPLNLQKEKAPFMPDGSNKSFNSDKTGFYKSQEDRSQIDSNKSQKRPIQFDNNNNNNNRQLSYQETSPRNNVPSNNTGRSSQHKGKTADKGFYRIRDPITQKVQTIYKSYQPEDVYDRPREEDEMYVIEQEQLTSSNTNYQQQRQPEVIYVVQTPQPPRQQLQQVNLYDREQEYEEEKDEQVIRANGVPLSFPPKRWNNR